MRSGILGHTLVQGLEPIDFAVSPSLAQVSPHSELSEKFSEERRQLGQLQPGWCRKIFRWRK
jgi:hypothetical protein